MHKRIYVFLDLSLSNPQKLVQGAHLSLESGRQFPCDTHPSIIMLALPEGDLDQTQVKLECLGIKFVRFFEPDINRYTGIATEPLTKEEAKKLSEFRLIKAKDFKEAM